MDSGAVKKIKIRNYQGAESVELELHEGVNVLIGPTDSGKSSVIRAAEDCSFNSLGHEHVTGGATKSEVEIDGVLWEKGGTVNRYSIGGEVFDKVGRGGVPEEVSRELGIREVEFGEGVSCRLNFAKQFDVPFMVGFKASDNAKIIGSLSGIHAVFNALRDATADHNKARRDVKQYEDSVAAAGKAVEMRAWVEPIAKRVKEAALLLKAIGEAQERLDGLRRAAEKLVDVRVEIGGHERVAGRLRALAAVDVAGLEGLVERVEKLEGLRRALGTVRKARTSAEAACLRLQAARGLDLGALQGVRVELDKKIALRATWKALSDNVGAEGIRVRDLGEGLREAREAYEAAVDGIEMCPITGVPMPDGCKAIIKERG